jgi:hypothetical protein
MTAQPLATNGKSAIVVRICGRIMSGDVLPPVTLAIISPPNNVMAMTAAAKPQSCQKSRQTIRRSLTSSPSIMIVHNSIDDPTGCPLNMSSQRPSGKPIHAGQIVRCLRRHATNISNPNGGKKGAVAITGNKGAKEPIIVKMIGVPVRRSDDGGRSIRVRGGRCIILPFLLGQLAEAV